MDVRTLSFDELPPRLAYDIWRLRQEVFVVEQACPYPDLDGRDVEPATRHVLLLDGEDLLGYLRVLSEGSGGSGGEVARVGRVVLAPAARGRGLGAPLMRAALDVVGDRVSVLSAQAPLAGWYGAHGYVVSGPGYDEDGIPHLPMTRPAGG
ncbi:ElaA protein [Nocardioides zeae]|uniref:ElaA protein n=1 Tax=Nocardioides zeae TaxID=1457234 RepID=A0ACC6IFH3_9ACTN|nr:GNAT family N-acetyltransferase [Nocardioides zeae]MDR6174933.1 ElaA protein [Nocardioides zeae]MDR6209257.1 ElaA protein [Nocardioides zeae]